MKWHIQPGRQAPRRRFLRAGTVFCAPLALLLAGCSGDPPVVVTGLAGVPGECTSADPVWQQLPDSDVRRSEAARNLQTNKEAFKSMRSNRAICRAGLKAAQKG